MHAWGEEMVTTVTTLTALQAALKAASPGDRLSVAPGAYATLSDFNGYKFASPGITVDAADPAHPPVFAGTEMDDVAGITFKGLEFLVNPRTKTVANVTHSGRVWFQDCRLHDTAKANLPGLMFRWSTDCGIRSSELYDLGTAIRFLDCDGITVETNSLHDLLGDGVQGWQSSRVTIARNHFTDFYPSAGDHPDAVQFFTANATKSCTDLTISDNVICRGAGKVIQGIFLGNEIGLAYVNVTIRGNMLVGTMYNGIAVGVGQNVTIEGNTVQPWADMNSWIVVDGITGGSSSGNKAGAFTTLNKNTDFTESGNVKIAAVAVGDVSMATFPASPPPVVSPPASPPAAPPAPLPPVPVVDVRDAVIAALQGAGLGALEGVTADRDEARKALADIAALAVSGAKQTSMAKAKPVFTQIGAIATLP